MKTAFTALLTLALLAVAGRSDAPKAKDTDKKPKRKFTIGKETTYVTGPLEKDGFVDYPAALNKRLSEGVTPANNAAVLLVKALGPRPAGRLLPPEVFRWLGISKPPEKGAYLVPLDRFLQDRFTIGPGKQFEEIDNQRFYASNHPWTAKDYPAIASWLKANEKPLAVVVEASKRPRYFWPLVPPQIKQGRATLIDTWLPELQMCREVGFGLGARAMLRLDKGDVDGAWQDLLTCHRLGRLLSHGAGFLYSLVGVSIDQIACEAELAFLARARLDAKGLERCLGALQALPPLPNMADKMDLDQRIMHLDCLQARCRYGIDYLQRPKERPDLTELVKIDWDPAFRKANRWFDRITAAMREKDYASWYEKTSGLSAELKLLHQRQGSAKGGAETVLRGWLTPQVFGEALGDVFNGLLIPAFSKPQRGVKRGKQVNDNVRVAFALAWYRQEHGGYPKTLEKLAPKYLKRIPGDHFSGKPLSYRLTAKGYLLYSVGLNGKDEGGRGYEDMPPGDDLAVRMPPPKPRK